ncbi:MAG: hypothetical protein JSS79_07790 [Bacteroidetes bacterium]|nr:hypothetical protein [Bacteroidota bacterium]
METFEKESNDQILEQEKFDLFQIDELEDRFELASHAWVNVDIQCNIS